MTNSCGEFCRSLTIFCMLVVTVVWLTFFELRDNVDPRIRQLSDMQPNKTFSLYLKSSPLPFNLHYIDVIGTAKKINNKQHLQPIIIIGLSSRFVDADDCISLLLQINSRQFQPETPVFLIKSKRSFVPSIQSIVTGNLRQLELVFNYLLDQQYIKKASILAFEESSLLLVRTLALSKIKNIHKIDKLTLINLMNPFIFINYQSSFHYNRQTCKLIASNSTKLTFFNNLRIILIDTRIDPYFRYSKYALKSYDFFIQTTDSNNTLNQYSAEPNFNFRNTVFINSRFINNVFASIEGVNYFALTVFSKAIVNFIQVDHRKSMNVTQIQYFFLFRAQAWCNASIESLQSYECTQFTYNFSNSQSVRSKQKCLKIRNSSQNLLKDPILIHGGYDYTVTNQDQQQIQYYQYSRFEKFYLIEKLSNKGTLFIVNKKGIEITMQSVQTFRPDFNPFPIKNQKYSLINICPGNLLVYPLNFQHSFWQHYLFITQETKQGQTCYLDISNFDLLYGEIQAKYSLITNLILFTLFCSHITDSSIFSKRLFTQFPVNLMLWLLNDYFEFKLAFLGNLIVIITVIFIEAFLRLLVYLFSYAKVRRKYCSKIVWCPLWVQILRIFIPFPQPPYWHLFMITLPFVIRGQATTILFLQLYLLKDNILYNVSNNSALFLMSCWLYMNLPDQQSPNSVIQSKHKGFLLRNPWKPKSKQSQETNKQKNPQYWQQTQQKILRRFPGLRRLTQNVGSMQYLNCLIALSMSIMIQDDFSGNLVTLIKSYIMLSLVMHIRQIIK